jgi:hypothetical protein
MSKGHLHPDNDNWDESATRLGQDARVTRGRDARDTRLFSGDLLILLPVLFEDFVADLCRDFGVA